MIQSDGSAESEGQAALKESVQGAGSHSRPEFCLFSSHVGLPLSLGHDHTQPDLTWGLRGCLLMAGALPWGSPSY